MVSYIDTIGLCAIVSQFYEKSNVMWHKFHVRRWLPFQAYANYETWSIDFDAHTLFPSFEKQLISKDIYPEGSE